AAAAARRLGVTSVVTCDSGEFVAIRDIGYGSQLRLRQRLAIRAATRLATAVTVCSHYQARLAAAHDVSAHVVPLSVDCAVFVPVPRPEGPPWRLLNVASLNPVKDHQTLLHAFHRLVQSG